MCSGDNIVLIAGNMFLIHFCYPPQQATLVSGILVLGGLGKNAPPPPPPPPIQEEESCLPNLNELFAFCACCSEHTKMYPPGVGQSFGDVNFFFLAGGNNFEV